MCKSTHEYCWLTEWHRKRKRERWWHCIDIDGSEKESSTIIFDKPYVHWIDLAQKRYRDSYDKPNWIILIERNNNKIWKVFFFTVGNFYIAMDFRRSFKPSERKRSNESMCGETKKKSAKTEIKLDQFAYTYDGLADYIFHFAFRCRRRDNFI